MADIRKEVMAQIRALRRRIDPRLLEQARNAVYFGQRPEKESARAAVASFLAARDDGGVFRQQLEAALRRQGQRLDALLPAEPAATPTAGQPEIKAETLLAAPLPQAKKPAKPAEKPKKSFWRRLF